MENAEDAACRADEQDRLRGRFDPSSQLVTFAGYREDDPNDMLVLLDQYHLNLSPDGRALNGAARNGGKWNARINLSR